MDENGWLTSLLMYVMMLVSACIAVVAFLLKGPRWFVGRFPRLTVILVLGTAGYFVLNKAFTGQVNPVFFGLAGLTDIFALAGMLAVCLSPARSPARN